MKIIIVDDEPKIRNGLKSLVEKNSNWHVLEVFADGISAVDFMKEHDIDLIITDIRMPGISGLDMIERIKSTNQNAYVVILSGYSDFDYAKKAIDLGVKKYLTKPTSPTEVIDIIAQIEKEILEKTNINNLEYKNIKNKTVVLAIEYINKNYSKKLSLADVAEYLNISPNYLSDLFKKNTNQNFSDYLIDTRIFHAKEYLKKSKLNINEIALKVGFSDSHYFSSVFKKNTGKTPKEYRNFI